MSSAAIFVWRFKGKVGAPVALLDVDISIIQCVTYVERIAARTNDEKLIQRNSGGLQSGFTLLPTYCQCNTVTFDISLKEAQ